MKELSLNILDIVQNSIRAGASEVEINIVESFLNDTLEIKVKDNGKGIPAELLHSVDDPFTTTRTTRKTGLGLPLLKYHAKLTGGDIRISSVEGCGTTVTALFGLSHIDRQPLGDIAGVMTILISANPGIDFTYTHTTDNGSYSFSSAEAKDVLEIDQFQDHRLLQDIRMMITGNLSVISVSE